MKNLFLSGIVFLFASSSGAWANEYWVPGTPLGAQVEFVTLEFGTRVVENTGGASNSRIELGLTGHRMIFCLDFSSYGQDATFNMALYQSLLDARTTGASVNILVQEETLLIKGVRVGVTDHSLALNGTGANAANTDKGLRNAGKFRYDLLGRNLVAGPSRPKADANAPIRATVSR
jgi:hypothetical protein